MKKFLFIPIILFMVIACLEPEHDNEYDPDNPDKAHITGTVRGYDWNILPDVRVGLVVDTFLIDETTSDGEGFYEFLDVDPGMYRLVAVHGYYRPMETDEFGVTAGADLDTADIYFQEIYFHFEDEPVGTVQPLGWEVLTDAWEIIQDTDEPHTHSVPNVYNGTAGIPGFPAIALFENEMANFSIGTEIKVLDTSGPEWEAGLVLRFSDHDNFYQFVIGPDYIVFREFVNAVPTVLHVEPVDIEEGVYYYIGAECYDNQIRLWFEDDIIQELDDNTFTSGSAGLWVFNATTTTSVNFDDIIIWP
jgi:hypothetical protein